MIGRGSCYSWAALSSNDSKTLYNDKNLVKSREKKLTASSSVSSENSLGAAWEPTSADRERRSRAKYLDILGDFE